MGGEGLIVLRAYAPAAMWLGLAVLTMAALVGLRDNPFTAALFSTLRWGPVAMTGWALLLLGSASYRLWRWERGDGSSCVTCGGPLGHEREGRANRGGAFRRCYACGKAVNHRHYE